jgi:hypothetical protein
MTSGALSTGSESHSLTDRRVDMELRILTESAFQVDSAAPS